MIQTDQATGRVLMGRLHPTAPVGGCRRLTELGHRGAAGDQAPLPPTIRSLLGTAVKEGAADVLLTLSCYSKIRKGTFANE